MVQRLAGTPVVVTVFYEALCPDSKNFVIKQLLPTFYKAPALVEVQLVPYGKAEVIVNTNAIIYSIKNIIQSLLISK